MFQILVIYTLISCLHVISFKTIINQNKLKYQRHVVMSNQISIALTRELGNNDGLRNLLLDYNCIELPCIAFGPGKDISLLNDAILSHDVITITSPQSANVFINAWNDMNKPNVNVATVGKGTSKVLISNGISPVFEPSDSTGECLSNELPLIYGKRVLYPASAIAENILQDGLTKRGFEVTRLNTYDTIPSTWTNEQLDLAKRIDIVTFASPSTIKIWTERVGNKAHAVVIGPTSAVAAKKYGYDNIYVPDGSKGLKAWADLIKLTADQLKNDKTS